MSVLGIYDQAHNRPGSDRAILDKPIDALASLCRTPKIVHTLLQHNQHPITNSQSLVLVGHVTKTARRRSFALSLSLLLAGCQQPGVIMVDWHACLDWGQVAVASFACH
jgi:hypothetical protein